MKETSARLLRLLALLQMRREWSGTDLAERLGVSTRTVRRDVDKLRDLDYPVNASMGITGGYWLGAGAELPPLLLDDEEAIAIAVLLRTATGGSVAGIGETALRALVKLEQVLPSRLRHRIDALQVSTVDVPGAGPKVDAAVLTAVATACRDHERLRFDYRDHRGGESVRNTEPYQLVNWGRRWYLVAWDVDREDWRSFRVDRLTPRIPTGPRFAPRELPATDAAAFVSRSVANLWAYQTKVRLFTPATSLKAQQVSVYGRVEPLDDHSCLLHIGADSWQSLTFLLGAIEVDFEVEYPSRFGDELLAMSERLRRAVKPDERR